MVQFHTAFTRCPCCEQYKCRRATRCSDCHWQLVSEGLHDPSATQALDIHMAASWWAEQGPYRWKWRAYKLSEEPTVTWTLDLFRQAGLGQPAVTWRRLVRRLSIGRFAPYVEAQSAWRASTLRVRDPVGLRAELLRVR